MDRLRNMQVIPMTPTHGALFRWVLAFICTVLWSLCSSAHIAAGICVRRMTSASRFAGAAREVLWLHRASGQSSLCHPQPKAFPDQLRKRRVGAGFADVERVPAAAKCHTWCCASRRSYWARSLTASRAWWP